MYLPEETEAWLQKLERKHLLHLSAFSERGDLSVDKVIKFLGHQRTFGWEGSWNFIFVIFLHSLPRDFHTSIHVYIHTEFELSHVFNLVLYGLGNAEKIEDTSYSLGTMIMMFHIKETEEERR